MLHNKEYHAMCALIRQCRKAIDEVLSKSDVYQRTQGYIKLANDNVETVATQIKRNNNFYEGAHSFKFYFDKGALVSGFYEIELSYRNKHNNYQSTSIGIDSFIILLDECGLLKDSAEEN